MFRYKIFVGPFTEEPVNKGTYEAETEEEIIDLAQSMAINLYQELAIANNWMTCEDCLVEAEKQINVKDFDSYDQYGETLEELTDEFFLDYLDERINYYAELEKS